MDRRDFIKLALLSVSMVAALAWGQNPVVKVEGGMIQGVPSAASGVTVFRGIPYAAPPVGDLRWKRPQPVAKWKGVKVADRRIQIFPWLTSTDPHDCISKGKTSHPYILQTL